jgi:hypothetical protein
MRRILLSLAVLGMMVLLMCAGAEAQGVWHPASEIRAGTLGSASDSWSIPGGVNIGNAVIGGYDISANAPLWGSDSSATNELQTISVGSGTLTLSDGGGTVTCAEITGSAALCDSNDAVNDPIASCTNVNSCTITAEDVQCSGCVDASDISTSIGACSKICDDATGGSSLWLESGSNIYRASGNVGIGISGPNALLQVYKDSSHWISIDPYYSSSHYHTIRSASTIYIRAGDSGYTNYFNTGGTFGTGSVSLGYGGTALITSYDSNEDITIDPRDSGDIIMQGKVGIGTTSPGSWDLYVNGQEYVSSHLRTGSYALIGTSIRSSDLMLDVGGKVGATYYCDQSGGNCKTIAQLASIPSNYVRDVEFVSVVHGSGSSGGAYCSGGKRPIGGGCSGNTIAYDQTLISSVPLPTQGWWCKYTKPPDNGFTVYAICAYIE